MTSSNDESSQKERKLAEKKKTNKQEKNLSSNALERIADALSKNQEPALSLPEIDEVDEFLIMLEHRIRKLPEEKQMELMQTFLQMLQELLEN